MDVSRALSPRSIVKALGSFLEASTSPSEPSRASTDLKVNQQGVAVRVLLESWGEDWRDADEDRVR